MMNRIAGEQETRILDDLPIGIYEIRRENGRNIVRYCNHYFARIFEFDAPEDVLGFDDKDLFASQTEYEEFLRVSERGGTADALIGYEVQGISRKGRRLVLVINSRSLFDENNQIIGRIGSVVDASEQVALREKVEEFTADIGSVLHAYTSTLLTLNHTISPIIQSFGPDPLNDETQVTPERAASAISEPSSRLYQSMIKLVALDRPQDRLGDLRQEIENLTTLLADCEREDWPLEFRPPVLAEVASRIMALCDEIEGRVPNELRKDLKRKARDLQRITNLVLLGQARDTIVEMDSQVRSLREYIIAGIRPREGKTVCMLSSLIAQANLNLAAFAKNRGINFRIQRDKPNVRVNVVERDVVRAVINLLHNAIKYSWGARGNKESWVSIDTRVVGHNALVEISNRGVPIPEDEIANGMIFQLGFRGRLSNDRGRIGTGIGLTDALRVAKAHGGNLVVQSRPANDLPRVSDRQTPFITTVILQLPVYEDKELP